MKPHRRIPSHFPQSLRDGAEAFRSLFGRVSRISNDTCCRFGEGLDGRNYVAVSDAIETSLRAVLDDDDALRREGYLRALADLLCLVADGAGYTEDSPDPLTTTEASFSGYA